MCVIHIFRTSMRLRFPRVSVARSLAFDTVIVLRCPQKVRFILHYSLYNPPRTKGDSGPSLDGQNLQVPRNRAGVHPGLALRPARLGPIPDPGVSTRPRLRVISFAGYWWFNPLVWA